MMIRYILSFILLGLLILNFNSQIFAQSGSTTGAIVGTVMDPQGAVISGATIKAHQIETNLDRIVQSKEDGTYTLPQLPPGSYELSVNAVGFSPVTEKFNLTIGATL